MSKRAIQSSALMTIAQDSLLNLCPWMPSFLKGHEHALPDLSSPPYTRAGAFRRMVRGQLSVDHFIYPLFVVPGDGVRHEIQSMPGNFHLSIDRLLEEVKEAQDLGIPDHFVWLTGAQRCSGFIGLCR